jgi:predicted NBD/HSP70 family sugar kinase
MLHLFVGNVVDAAIVTGGTTHRGARSAAGDVAHLALGDPAISCPCGRSGCLQATVADQAWAHRAWRAGVWSSDRPCWTSRTPASRYAVS